MLQRLRDKSQGWFAYIILGMIAVTFVLFGTSSMFGGSGDRQEVVAKVDGTKITARQLDIAYQQLLKQQQNETLSQLDPNFVKKELLESLVEQAILLQQADQLKMSISPSRIITLLSSIPFLVNEEGQFSREAYERFLTNANYTDQSFRQLLEEGLVREQLQQGIVKTSFSLPQDIKELAKFLLQKRNFRYTVIDKEPIEKTVKITDSEIKDYYQAHLKNYQTEEQVSVEYIHLSLQDLMNKYEPKAAELEQFYHDNIHLFTKSPSIHVAHILVNAPKFADTATLDKAKATVAEIEKKLANGESFEALAKTYSEDKGSSQQGGTLDWFSKGEMVPEFETAAFELQKAGDVSKPVRTEFGFHLIKLLDKKPEQVDPFTQAKSEVETKLKQQHAEEQLINLADQLSTLTYDTPDNLQNASDKLSLPIAKSEIFTRSKGPKESLLNHSDIINAAFSDAVKEDKNNSDLIKIDDENYLVLRVAKFYPATQKSIDVVKDEIKDLLIHQKTEKLLAEQANGIVKSIKDADAAKLSGLVDQYQWTDKQNILRSSHEIDPEIITAAFSLPRPLGEKARDLKTAQLKNGNFAIVWLSKVDDGDVSQLSELDKQNYQAALTKHWGELEFALYATDLFKEAKVEKHLEKI